MLSLLLSLLYCYLFTPLAWAQSSSSYTWPSAATASPTIPASPPVYTISAENITAKLTPYGARLMSLTVPDRNGDETDVAVGYDNTTDYIKDTATNRTFFGAVVGRFANRIKNGTFSLDGNTYNIPENEHGGEDTLHGGTIGYDGREWNLTSVSNSSITFSLLDTGFEGFPGTVLTFASFAVSTETTGSAWGTPHPRLTTQLTSFALDLPTPIMLANHIYWNLNAFTEQTILNDTTLWMPYSDRYIQIDNIEVPNGSIATTASWPTLDFTSPKLIGRDIDEAVNACGLGCTGYDNAYIVDRPVDAGLSSAFPVLSAWSSTTGIRMDVSTNQPGIQIYSCNGQNGTIPVKPSQISRNEKLGINGTDYVNQYSCLVVESQSYIGAVNYPQFGNPALWNFDPTSQVSDNYQKYDFTTY